MTTKAKSDQLNSDDLIGGDITIKITDVKINVNDAQSGVIHYEGDNGKPFKPCKSMRRVIELKWGSDEQYFVGKSMTLCRDATVKWAGEEVGGIRITHMSDMKEDNRFMLTYSRNVKRAYKVEHLKIEPTQPTFINAEQIEVIQTLLNTADWDITDFCGVMKVNALSEIGAVKFDNLKTKLNAKISKQYEENNIETELTEKESK